MKALTFIEVLVCITIVIIVIGGVFMVFQSANMSWQSEMVMLDIQQQSRTLMTEMTRELRQSISSPSITGPGNSRIDFFIPKNITCNVFS